MKWIAVNLTICLLAGFILTGCSSIPLLQKDEGLESEPEGVKVVLFLDDGQELRGELLWVRDTALVLSTPDTVKDVGQILVKAAMKVAAHAVGAKAIEPMNVAVVPNEAIDRLIIKGESKVLKDMGKGLIAGVALGLTPGVATIIAIYPAVLAFGDDESAREVLRKGLNVAAIGALLGGVLGSGIGALEGWASSRGDEVIFPPPDGDYSFLKRYARYRWGEPFFLRDLK